MKLRSTGHTLFLLAAVMGLGLKALAADTTPRSLKDVLQIQKRVQQVLPTAMKATVGIDGGGSGVIVSADGLVLTAAHVSREPGRRVSITLPTGREVRGRALGVNDEVDAGLVRITEQGEWPYVKMAAPALPEAGTWCFALGHPSGFDIERGPVLRVGRVIGSHPIVMRTDCHLIGGDSGGPLFNLEGQVIGIHSRVSSDIEDNYHAPIHAFQRHWKFLLEGESISWDSNPDGGVLGVDTEPHLDGALVTEVFGGTAADRGGLRVGDVLVAVNEIPVYHAVELGWALRRHSPGTEVTVRVMRGRQVIPIRVKLGRKFRNE